MEEFPHSNEDKTKFGLYKIIQEAQEKAEKQAEKQFDIDKWFKEHPPQIQSKIKLKFKNESTNEDPFYATEGSSGFDLRANVDDGTILEVGDRMVVPTGLFFEIPEGFEIQIRPRSGLAAKKGVTVLNSPGTIDWDYRGEIKIILINHGREAFIINHGERIAQGVMAGVLAEKAVNLQRVTEITEDTDRGSGGFGSTDKN